MNPLLEFQLNQTRRQFFGNAGIRLGGLALATLGAGKLLGAADPAVARIHPPLPGFPHFAPKAKRLIYLHMNGAPSQLDLWDHKPKLQEYFDKDLPDSVRNGQRITTMTSGQTRFPVAPTMFKFNQAGQSGRWISELLPHTARVVDEIAVLKSVQTNAINHDPACTFVMTGSEVPGKASLGSWLAYGLGSENNELPAFVVLTPNWSSKADAQALFTRMWSSGYLPTRYTGVALRSIGDPVLYIDNPPGVSREDRRVVLDALNRLNAKTHERWGDPETLTRIAQYEMAFRMQSSVPDLVDFSSESKATTDLYGDEVKKPGTFAASALLARRLVERGVRCVQILHRGWDQHGNLPTEIRAQCKDIDQASAALIHDLKARGLLEDTLVWWGGEFGRTPVAQGGDGRDHNPHGFTHFLAGAGVKPGFRYGATDDYGYYAVDGKVHFHDLHATILHLLGFEHTRLTYRHAGRDFRLTDIKGELVKPILA
jgi:hypothetical protein